MNLGYTDERNVLMTISLLKAHQIKKVVVSPGAQNVTFVAGIQKDPFFEVYSSVDERSAAYMACGLAAESGEPVALSCTGATASRNYYPGLTEAYYRNLPVLAITSTPHTGRIGNLFPQVIDRSELPNDIVKLSVQVPSIHNEEDAWACNVALNRAMLELHRHNGGPAHINLATSFSRNYDVKELPKERVIWRIDDGDVSPEMPNGKIAIFDAGGVEWTMDLTQAVDAFCGARDAVVLCGHVSNYHGQYRVLANLVTEQKQYNAQCRKIDLLIHIGCESEESINIVPGEVWRVHPDGEILDEFHKLTCVFEMEEKTFFRRYTVEGARKIDYLQQWKMERAALEKRIPELPFSNLWLAQHIADALPASCMLYIGIRDLLCAGDFFEIPENVTIYANEGGFGEDGGFSPLLGVLLGGYKKLCFGVISAQTFLGDTSVLSNTAIDRNIRLLVVNKRGEIGRLDYGRKPNDGHKGRKTNGLVESLGRDLGFEYMVANGKDEFLEQGNRFFTPENTERPMLFEVILDGKKESEALKLMCELDPTSRRRNGEKVGKDFLRSQRLNTLKYKKSVKK